MNRATFYTALKNTSAFGAKLSTPQVQGMDALLDVVEAATIKIQMHHVANMFAQNHHETGGYMFPIKETVMPSHEDKNPSDAEVIRRLDKAWEKGQLSWVKEPYWRDGWFGRGGVQITHKDNYAKLAKATGVDLVGHPELALTAPVSALIIFTAMTKGLFTGKKLEDYKFPEALDAVVAKNPRRIINGKDGTDAAVAKLHRVFYNALLKAKYGL